jgi:hypothetical protein
MIVNATAHLRSPEWSEQMFGGDREDLSEGLTALMPENSTERW